MNLELLRKKYTVYNDEDIKELLKARAKKMVKVGEKGSLYFSIWDKVLILMVLSLPFFLIFMDKKYQFKRKRKSVKTSKILWFALFIIMLFTIYMIDTFYLAFSSYAR